MKKSERIAALLDPTAAADSALDPRYAGFFTHFNAGRYYEAHDVLEHLWLSDLRSADAPFYKALIQVAGAFVHLQKQYLHPRHAKHGRRLRPAARLLALAAENLAPFSPVHLHLEAAALRLRCTRLATEIIAGDYTCNPWHPGSLLGIQLLVES